MTDGVIVSGGTIASVLHGFTGGTPTLAAGQSWVPLPSVAGLERGHAVPSAATQQLAASDFEMSRGVEDLAVALLNKGALAKSDLPAALVDKINTRRTLRNEGTL